MLGEFNLWWKFRFLEGSAHVPLLIRTPRFFRGGRVVQQNVKLCDLFATLCGFADTRHKRGVYAANGIPAMFLCPGDLCRPGWAESVTRRIYDATSQRRAAHMKA